MRLFGRLNKIRSSGWGMSKSKSTKVSSGRVLNDFEYTDDRIFFYLYYGKFKIYSKLEISKKKKTYSNHPASSVVSIYKFSFICLFYYPHL